MTAIKVIDIQANYTADTLQSELMNRTIWKNVAIISHNLPLISTLSICENIMLPIQYFENVKRAQAESIVFDMLSKYQLSAFMHSKPKKLNEFHTLVVKYLRAIIRNPHQIFFILPHRMLQAEDYSKFVNFIKEIDRAGVNIVENYRYIEEYSGLNYMEIPYNQWQTLVLKTLK